jgi:polygalacturonase
VEGVTLQDSWGWTFPIVESEHVQVSNIKILGYRANSDGIDICNSRDVQVSDSYLRTFDDLIVIKSLFNGAAQDITIKHCVLWNEFAHALSLGAELRKPVENILFSDCDIIHDKGREWLLRIYNCDSATVKNVVFDNIRIEEARRLISLWIGKAFWSKDPERGHIETITFSNLHSVKPEVTGPWADLVGMDAEHAIDGVQFNQVQVNDQAFELHQIKQNKFVSGVEVQP